MTYDEDFCSSKDTKNMSSSVFTLTRFRFKNVDKCGKREILPFTLPAYEKKPCTIIAYSVQNMRAAATCFKCNLKAVHGRFIANVLSLVGLRG